MSDQYLGTRLDLNLFGADLLGQALLTLQLVRFVKQLFAGETLDTIVEGGVLLDIK